VKWVGLIAVLAAILPVSVWLRRNPSHTPKAWMLMGFLPFGLIPFHLFVAPISWAGWEGYVQGVEVSVLDTLAVTLYLTLPGARNPIPFRLSMALYFMAVLLSVFQAGAPVGALFYLWQLARMFLIYAVVTRGVFADPRVAPALMTGLAAGLFMEGGIVVWQRFGLGLLQTPGTFFSQNILGLVSHLVVFPFFALLLAGTRGWLPAGVAVAGVLVEVLTTSRATVGLAGFGYATVFVLSALRQWTSRKLLVLSVGAVAVAALTPLALSAFERRLQVLDSETYQNYDEREAFKAAAAMILADHPMGVGANNYVIAANIGGYNQRAGVAPVNGSEAAHVHNIYWLVAAETGYLGLVTFVFLLLCPLTVALRCGWRYRGDKRGDLLLGIGVAMLLVYLHSFFEWNFIGFEPQYVFALQMGLVAGLAQQLGYWRQSFRQSVQSGVGARVNQNNEGRTTASAARSLTHHGLTR
jgi:O-antigen ligase